MIPGEFDLLRALGVLGSRPEGVAVGPGDDTAVLDLPAGRLLFTADAVVEGVHFLRDRTDPADLGHKVVAVNVSDVAAMGGTPLAFTLTLTVPPALDLSWLRAFHGGLSAAARAYGCSLAGGDTTAGPAVVLSVALLGTCAGPGPVLRSGARPGDDLHVSGCPGESAAGLERILSGRPGGDPAWQRLVRRHHRPEPRLALGRELGASGRITAMIDVSDGLLQDLEHVLAASGVGADLELERVPVSTDLRTAVGPERARELVLVGGEDYELLFTAPPAARDAVAAAARAAGTPVHRIGRITAGPATRLLAGGREVPLPARRGYEHFGDGRPA